MRVVDEVKVHWCEGIAEPIADGSRWHFPSVGSVRRHGDGTVIECEECGATWVAGHMPGLMGNIWRREARWERRRRERRARRAARRAARKAGR